MKCQSDIIALAEQRLKDAECLCQQGMYDGSFYMGGYVIELLLKAKVCKNLGIDNFFDYKRFKNRDLMYKPFRVHDYEQLMILSGIYGHFESQMQTGSLKSNWSVIRQWSSSLRYLAGKTKKDAEDFLISINQISSWIKKYL